MPLDVLSKIQSFANGGSVDAGTKGAINQMIGDAQQNPSIQSGLRGIANAVTNNGADINPDTMAKLARAGQAFSKAMEQANLAMLGIHGSFNAIDVKPLEKAEASLVHIAENGNGIQISMDTKRAESSLEGIVGRIEKIRSNSNIHLSVNASVPHSMPISHAQHNFAKGGKVTYHKENTETAQTGGIFRRGSSVGDRNMIFANKGEGIITERAMKQGARQRGMSPEAYIHALNHPSVNLGKIKRGRKFEYGGLLATNPPGALADAQAQNELDSLMHYLKSNRFHGSEKKSSSPTAKKLGEELDAYMTNIGVIDATTGTLGISTPDTEIKKILTKAKALEEQYKDRINATTGRVRAASVSSAPASHLSAFNAGIANPTTSTGINLTTTASQRDSLKSAARLTMQNSAMKFEGLNDLERTTEKGTLRKIANEAMTNLNELLQKLTSEQIDGLHELLKDSGYTNGIDDLQAALNDFETDFNTDAEATVSKLKAFTFSASHIDTAGIAKKYEQAIMKLRENALQALDLGSLSRNAVGTRQAIDIKEYLKTILNSAGLTEDDKAKYKDIAKGFETVKKSGNANKVAQYGLEQEFGLPNADFAKIMDKLSSGMGVGGLSYEETLKKVLKVMKMVEASADSFKDSVEALSAAWDNEVNSINKVIKQLPILSELTDEQMSKYVTWIALMSLAAKGVQKFGTTIADFVTKQAELSAGLTRVAQSIDTFSGKASNFDALRRSLNLTREQAVALGESMSQIAVQGVHSVDTVANIAQNLKNALGKVDTTLLKEAVDLIKDLPKEQVDVIVSGKGTFDDKANLIANLMKDGNLEKSINLMMNGAFGDMEGSVQLDEKDKAVIAAQEEGNKLLDDIKQGLYSFVPKGFATVSAKYAKMIGQIAQGVATVWTLYTISRNVATIAMQMAGTGTGGSGANTGGILGGVKDAWSRAHATPGGPVSWKTFGSNIMNSQNSSLVNLAAGISAYAGTKLVSVIADQIEKNADKRDREHALEYQKNASLNMSVYGTAAGRYQEKWNSEEAQRSAAKYAKITSAVAGSAAALGVALAGPTLGLSVLEGAAIAAGAAIVGGLIGGIAGFVSKMNSLQDTENPYSHVKVRKWWFDTYEEDANADERRKGMERIYSDLERKYMEAHGGGAFSDKSKYANLMLKEMVQLNKHVKAIEMITKGRFTAFDEGTAQGNASLMKRMSQFGGTNSSYMGASMRAFTMFSQAYAKNNRLMNDRKMRIVNDNSLGEEEKANALNALFDEEMKMHEKFINNMMNVIKAFGELPEVIVHNLKAEMDNAFNNYMSGGFLGGRNLAVLSAQENLQSGTHDMLDLMRSNSKNNQMIQESVSFLKQRHHDYQEQLDDLQKETGIASDEQALKALAEIRGRYEGQDGNLVDLVAGYQDLQSFANGIIDDKNKNVGSDDKKIDAVIGQYESRIDKIIKVLELQEENTTDQDELNEIGAAITKLQDIQSKDMDNNQKWKELVSAMRNIPTVLKHMQSKAAEMNPADAKMIESIQKRLSLSALKASLQDPNVYAQKMRTEQAKQFVQKMEDLSKRFKDSLETVLKNGAVQMADAIKSALEKSEEFDMFGNGNAVWDTVSAGVDSAIEKFSAADKARDLVQKSFSMEEGSEFRKQFEEGMQKYFEELESSAKEQSGNEAEKFIADRIDSIYKLMVEEKKNEISKEENRMLGEGLRKIGMAQLDNRLLKELGLGNSSEDVEKLSDEEIGRRIHLFETNLAEKYKTEQGMSESDAKKMARQETAQKLSSYFLSAGISSGYRVNQKRLADVQKLFSERDSSTSEKMAGIDEELKPKLEELEKQKEEEIRANREEAKRILDSTEEGQKYLKLICEQAMLSNRLLLNPHDEEAKSKLKEITDKISSFENDNFSNLHESVQIALKAAAATAANATKAHKEAMDAQANAKDEYMRALKSIATAVDKAVQCGENLVMIARTERLESQQQFESEYGDVGRAIGMRGSLVESARAAKMAQMSRIPEARQKGMAEIDRLYRQELANAKSEDDRVAAVRKRNWSIEKLETALSQTQIRIHKEMVDKIQQAYRPALDALDRYKEGAGIMKDLFETMGAPFEYILDIENNLVAVAKAYAEQQMNILEDMRKSEVNGAEIKKQELKTIKAQAEAVKAMYGAQRNALDKLLGSMMGTFTQLEGVFGPDSEFAKVWKVGQGYTQFPSGLIAASGGSNMDWGSRLLSHLGTTPKQFHGQGFSLGEMFGGMFANGGVTEKVDEDTHRNQNAIANGGVLNGLTKGDKNIIRVNGNEVIATAQQAQRAGGAIRLMSILRNGTLPKMENAYEWMKANIPGFAGGGISRYSGIRGEATKSHNGRIVNTMSMYDVNHASDGWLRWFYGHPSMDASRQFDAERMIAEQRRAVEALGGKRVYNLAYDQNIFGNRGRVRARTDNQYSPSDITATQYQPSVGATSSAATAYGGQGGAFGDPLKNVQDYTNTILLKILKDTHGIAEAMGISVDWKEIEELAQAVKSIGDSVNGMADNVRADVNDPDRIRYFNEHINPAFAGKTTGELIEMRDSLVDKSIKNNTLGNSQVKRQIYELNNAILYDKLLGKRKNPEGTSQGGNEMERDGSLSVEEETLKYVKLIYWAIVGQVGSSLDRGVQEQKKSNETEESVKKNGEALADSQQALADSQQVIIDQAVASGVQSVVLLHPASPLDVLPQTSPPPPAEPAGVKNPPKTPPPTSDALAQADASVKEAGGNGEKGIAGPTAPTPVGGRHAAKALGAAPEALPNGKALPNGNDFSASKSLPAESAEPKALPSGEERLTVDDILGPQREKAKVGVHRGYDKSQFATAFRGGMRLGGEPTGIGSFSLRGSKPPLPPLKLGGEITPQQGLMPASEKSTTLVPVGTNNNGLLSPSRGNGLPPPPAQPGGANASGAGEAGNAAMVKRESTALVRSDSDTNLPAVSGRQNAATGGNMFAGNLGLRNAALDALAVTPALLNIYKQATGSDYEKELYRRTLPGDVIQSAAGLYAVHGQSTFPNLFGNASSVAGAPISAETSLAPTWMKNLGVVFKNSQAWQDALSGQFDSTKFGLWSYQHNGGMRIPSSITTLEDLYSFAADVDKGMQGDMEAFSRVANQFKESMDSSSKPGTAMVKRGSNLPVKVEGQSIINPDYRVIEEQPSQIEQFGKDVNSQFRGMLNQNVGVGGTVLTALALANSAYHGRQNAILLNQYGLRDQNFQNLTLGNEAKNSADAVGKSAILGAGINAGIAYLGGVNGAAGLAAAGMAGATVAAPTAAAAYFVGKDAEQATLLNLEQKDYANQIERTREQAEQYFRQRTAWDNEEIVKGMADVVKDYPVAQKRAQNVRNNQGGASVAGDIFGSSGATSTDLLNGLASNEASSYANDAVLSILGGKSREDRWAAFQEMERAQAKQLISNLQAGGLSPDEEDETRKQLLHHKMLATSSNFDDAILRQKQEIERIKEEHKDQVGSGTFDERTAKEWDDAQKTLKFIEYVSSGMESTHQAGEKWLKTVANVASPTPEAVELARKQGLSPQQAIDMEHGKAMQQAYWAYSLKKDENGNAVVENGQPVFDQEKEKAFLAERKRRDLVAQGVAGANDVQNWGADLAQRERELQERRQRLDAETEEERLRQEEKLQQMSPRARQAFGIESIMMNAIEGQGREAHYAYDENGRIKQVRNPKADEFIEQQTQMVMAQQEAQYRQDLNRLNQEKQWHEEVAPSLGISSEMSQYMDALDEQKKNSDTVQTWVAALHASNESSVKEDAGVVQEEAPAKEAEQGATHEDIMMEMSGNGIGVPVLTEGLQRLLRKRVLATLPDEVAQRMKAGEDFAINTAGLTEEDIKAKQEWISRHQKNGVNWDVLEQMDRSYAPGDYKFGALPDVVETPLQSYYNNDRNLINVGRNRINILTRKDYNPFFDSTAFAHEYGHWRAKHALQPSDWERSGNRNDFNRQVRENVRSNQEDFKAFLDATGFTEEQLEEAQRKRNYVRNIGSPAGIGVQELISQHLYGANLEDLTPEQLKVTYAATDTLNMVSGGKYGYGHNASNQSGLNHNQGRTGSEEYAHANTVKVFGDEKTQAAFAQMFPNAASRGNAVGRAVPNYENQNATALPTSTEASTPEEEPTKAPEPEVKTEEKPKATMPTNQGGAKKEGTLPTDQGGAKKEGTTPTDQGGAKEENAPETPKPPTQLSSATPGKSVPSSAEKQPKGNDSANKKNVVPDNLNVLKTKENEPTPKEALKDSKKERRDVTKSMAESIYPLIKKDESVIGYLRRIYELLVSVFGAQGTSAVTEEFVENALGNVNDNPVGVSQVNASASEYKKSTGNTALDITNQALNLEMASLEKRRPGSGDASGENGNQGGSGGQRGRGGMGDMSRTVERMMLEEISAKQLIIDKILAKELVVDTVTAKEQDVASESTSSPKDEVLLEKSASPNATPEEDATKYYALDALSDGEQLVQARLEGLGSFGQLGSFISDRLSDMDSSPRHDLEIPKPVDEGVILDSQPRMRDSSSATVEKVKVDVTVHVDSKMFTAEVKKSIIELQQSHDIETQRAVGDFDAKYRTQPLLGR